MGSPEGSGQMGGRGLPATDVRDLIVEIRDGSPRRVRVEGPDGSAAERPWVMPETMAERTRGLRRAMVQHGVSRLAREVGAAGAPAPLDQKALGEELFGSVFSGDLYGIYSVWRAEPGRLRLRLRVPAALAYLPWELLRDPYQKVWLALTNDVSLVREVDSSTSAEPSPVDESGLSVLAVGANPIDLPRLAVDHERTILEGALASNGRVTWAAGDAAVVLELLDDRTADHHVFHFAGHGSFDGAGGALYWGEGLSQRLDSEKLSTLLARHRTIRLAVLNACEGATSGTDADSPSIANVLVQRGVPAVLAMQAPILDEAALDAARTFYRSLARGVAIDDAVTDLRRALETKNLDWAAPVLTVANAERALFSREKEQPLLVQASSPPAPPPPPPWKTPVAIAGAALLLGATAVIGYRYWPRDVDPDPRSGAAGATDPGAGTGGQTTTTTGGQTTTTSGGQTTTTSGGQTTTTTTGGQTTKQCQWHTIYDETTGVRTRVCD